MRTLDIKYYALIDAIAEQGSVKAAAASLSLTQPAISHRMREMERRLAVTLFERRGHHIHLTPAAHRLLTTAREVIPKLMTAERDAVALAKSSVPSIKWGVDAHDSITRIVCCNLNLIPSPIDIRRVTNGELTQSLLEGDSDVALLNEPPQQRGIMNRLLFTDTLVAVVPATSPLAERDYVMPDDVAAQPYITYSSRRQAGYEFDLFFHPADVSPGTIKIIESVELILQVISKSQEGVTILSSWEASTVAHDKSLAIRRLQDTTIDIPWYLSHLESLADDGPLREIEQAFKKMPILTS